MILIKCPYCGERDQSEFANGGEAHVIRPKNPESLSDKDWGEYVFFRNNPKGIFYERWVHSHGCKKWFNAVRNTSTDQILKVYILIAVGELVDLKLLQEVQMYLPTRLQKTNHTK